MFPHMYTRNTMATVVPCYRIVKRIWIPITVIFLLYLSVNNILTGKFNTTWKKWEYLPATSESGRPLYGIVMAGTSDKFRWNFGLTPTEHFVSPCIAKLYAMKHNYAFALVNNLEHINYRKYAPCDTFPQWNKIKVIERYLSEVDILLWIDLDAVIAQFNKPLTEVLPNKLKNSACSNSVSDVREFGRGIPSHNLSDLPGAASDAFLWATLDINAAEYSLNLNTAVMALRRGDTANDFLRLVWQNGEDPTAFQRHDKHWLRKKPCVAYYGWPWEQGAVWDVLVNKSHGDMLRSTCLLPHTGPQALNSILDYWKDGTVHPGRPFITHKPYSSAKEILRAFVRNFDVPPAAIHEHCHTSVAAMLEL